ncbi:hypothetical protein C9374_009556 [Naegleria lovaniensis]|uniref:Elongin-A n=1 Tax=Naegleria lovaniensis TaxID=51637 RepID=A0AA88KRT5_NAELO|nr:uncharacterized protein C9374_009556 [Naegleria lovaniensis]KAG2392979.1 hypothetical protein C9374_009556 [Naegleria lovaniensis]
MSQAPPRQKTTAPASSQSSGNMTARRKQGANLQFEAMKSTAIPSLFDMCAKLLQSQVDCLPVLENVEDVIVQRILSACDAPKLDEIETKNENAGVNLNTDDLWRILTIRDFGGAFDKGNGTWKELYNKLNQEKMAREKKLREIKESNKVEKKGSRIISGSTAAASVNNKHSKEKHTTQTIDPVVARRASSNTIRNSSSRSRSSSSSSSKSRSASTTTTATTKKSKLWTKSLGETSTARKSKESTTTTAPQKIFTPGKPPSTIVTTDFNADRYKSNYAKSSVGSVHVSPVIMKQPVFRAASNIDFTRQRPSSPPTSDSIATDSPLVSPSYVDSMFCKETSKRMEKLKRQTENDSARRQTHVPTKNHATSTVPSKQQRPPPSSHNSSSLAPPQKKVKPTEQPSHSNFAGSASNSLNFTIPKKKK